MRALRRIRGGLRLRRLFRRRTAHRHSRWRWARRCCPTRDEVDPATFLPSSRSVAFRKAAWAAVGGYPEWLDYCEDLVFDLSLRERGAARRVRAGGGRRTSARAARCGPSGISISATRAATARRSSGKGGTPSAMSPIRRSSRSLHSGSGGGGCGRSPSPGQECTPGDRISGSRARCHLSRPRNALPPSSPCRSFARSAISPRCAATRSVCSGASAITACAGTGATPLQAIRRCLRRQCTSPLQNRL